MRLRKANFWVPMALLLICLALVVLIYQQLTMATDSEALARSLTERKVDLPDLPLTQQFTMAKITDYRAVLDRPLFSPNRRPPPEDTTTAAANKEFDFDLKGVVIKDDVRTALFRRQTDGEVVRLTKGDEIQGWTLTEIELDFVVIERDGREEVLEPSFDARSHVDTTSHQDKVKK